MPCRVLSGGHTCGLSRNVRQVCQRMGADCRSPFLYHQGYYYPILASQGKQKRQIRKLLKYLLIGSTVFIVYECTVAALKGNLSECLNIWITSGTIAKFLFFNAFPFAGHLWYMYALLYVYAILNPNRSLDTPSPFLIGKTRLSGILPASVRILFLATPRRSPLRLRLGEKHAA